MWSLSLSHGFPRHRFEKTKEYELHKQYDGHHCSIWKCERGRWLLNKASHANYYNSPEVDPAIDVTCMQLEVSSGGKVAPSISVPIGSQLLYDSTVCMFSIFLCTLRI